MELNEQITNPNLKNSITVHIDPELAKKIMGYTSKNPRTNLGLARVMEKKVEIESCGEHMEAIADVTNGIDFTIKFSTGLINVICEHAMMAWPFVKGFSGIGKNLIKKLDEMFKDAYTKDKEIPAIADGDIVRINYTIGTDPEVRSKEIIVGSGKFNHELEMALVGCRKGHIISTNIDVMGSSQKVFMDIMDVQHMADLEHVVVERNSATLVRIIHTERTLTEAVATNVYYVKYIVDKYGNISATPEGETELSQEDLNGYGNTIISKGIGDEVSFCDGILDNIQIKILKTVSAENEENYLNVAKLIAEDEAVMNKNADRAQQVHPVNCPMDSGDDSEDQSGVEYTCTMTMYDGAESELHVFSNYTYEGFTTDNPKLNADEARMHGLFTMMGFTSNLCAGNVADLGDRKIKIVSSKLTNTPSWVSVPLDAHLD